MSEGGDEVIDPAEIDDLLKSANLGTPPHAGAVPPGVGPAAAPPASPQVPQAAAQAATATATTAPPRAARDLTAGEEISTSEIEALFKAHVPPTPARAAAPAAARNAPARPEARSVESNLRRVEDGVRAALAGSSPSAKVQPQDARPFEFEQFDLSGLSPAQISNISTVRDVELDLRIELGRAELLIDEVLKLREGSVVPLDKLAGDPVDILVNGRLVARGEVLVLNDNFCVRVAEILISAG